MKRVSTSATLTIDVVVPTYGSWEHTKSCLEHLARQTRPHSVIVADNASTDGTPAKLRSAFPEARLVGLPANRGFASACNHGAREGGGEIIVLLNNDVDCSPDFLERLVAPLEEDAGVGSVAAVLLQADGRSIESAGFAADRTLAAFLRLRGRPPADADSSGPVLAGALGGAAAYRRTAWEQVGGLDEGVFMYCEDVDLAFRLRAAGWRSVLATDAVAVHLGSGTIGRRSAGQRRYFGFARGYFMRRYGVMRGRAAVRALVTESIVVAGDAVFSRDLAALRGRVAGWRAAAGLPRHAAPPRDAIDERISFGESLRLRRRSYAG